VNEKKRASSEKRSRNHGLFATEDDRILLCECFANDCQAEGRRFETDHPLHKSDSKIKDLDDSPNRVRARAFCYHSRTTHLAAINPPLTPIQPTFDPGHAVGFAGLASRLFAVAHGVYCDDACYRTHENCDGCEHQGHACGCPHSESYDFDWEPSDDVAERWSQSALASLLTFISKLECATLSVEEIQSRLEWWWRGENRALRKALETVHRTRCERGRGVLINRITGEQIPNRCKSWRDCSYCAWVYGAAVERLFEQVKHLRAFVVLTMPPELADWTNKDHIAAQARAMRRLAERLMRAFGHRFAMIWTREHNTKIVGKGRLHLNVLWDENWVDQEWLSEVAAAYDGAQVTPLACK
jgi:hypothetical protein